MLFFIIIGIIATIFYIGGFIFFSIVTIIDWVIFKEKEAVWGFLAALLWFVFPIIETVTIVREEYKETKKKLKSR